MLFPALTDQFDDALHGQCQSMKLFQLNNSIVNPIVADGYEITNMFQASNNLAFAGLNQFVVHLSNRCFFLT